MSDPTITGRTRRRGTRRSVYWADIVARWLIAAGGIGTIIAVSLVCVFLLSVVAPLFWPAKVGPRVENAWSAPASDPARPAATDAPLKKPSSPEKLSKGDGAAGVYCCPEGERILVDDYATAAIVVSPAGQVTFARLADGAVLDEKSPLADQTVTALAFDDRTATALVGLENGEARLLTPRFDIDFASPEQLAEGASPLDTKHLALGSTTTWNHALATRTALDQFRIERLGVELESPLPLELTGPIRRLDFVAQSQGLIVCALTADGTLTVAEVARHKNELTDEFEYEVATRATIAWQDHAAGRGLPDFLLISGLADNVYLAWSDGELDRYFVGDLKNPRFAEKRDLAPDAATRLTALRFATGGATLVAGDSQGGVQAWFRAELKELDTPDRRMLFKAHEFAPTGSAITRIAPLRRGRSVAVGNDHGVIRILYLTTAREIAEMNLGDGHCAQALAIAPRDDAVVALGGNRIAMWTLDPGYPEVSFRSLFLPVWYENNPAPSYTWQSSSSAEGSEPKLSLTPLVFGTLKATLYAMAFGVPLAFCAAIYTSEFMRPEVKARVKPAIELMASLPSVVLGYIGGLVLAPFTEHVLSSLVASLFTTPLACLSMAHLWQLLPRDWTLKASARRFWFIALAVPLGVAASLVVGPWAERLLFAGDLRGWLDGQVASPLGGWFVLLLAPMAAVSVWLAARFNGWLRPHAYAWRRELWAWVDTTKFLVGAATTVALAYLVALALTALGFDPRGGLVGQYEQKNALVVGFVMGFAIIPLIYTIADDALSTVPEHLRSASLGAGATPWQTAIRIIVPTAMSGLFSAMMIGLGRAVGETMIVLMATGGTPIMDWNMFNGFRTLSAMIAAEAPEAVQGSSIYRTIFFAALTLFMLTFVLNTVAEVVRLRFRRRAYEL